MHEVGPLGMMPGVPRARCLSPVLKDPALLIRERRVQVRHGRARIRNAPGIFSHPR